MDVPDTAQSPVRKAGKSLSLVLASLLYLVLLIAAANIFYASDCLIFGPEQIVGALNVGYLDDGRFYYTNPVAILFRRVLYLILSAAVTWLAAAECGARLHLSHPSESGPGFCPGCPAGMRNFGRVSVLFVPWRNTRAVSERQNNMRRK